MREREEEARQEEVKRKEQERLDGIKKKELARITNERRREMGVISWRNKGYLKRVDDGTCGVT